MDSLFNMFEKTSFTSVSAEVNVYILKSANSGIIFRERRWPWLSADTFSLLYNLFRKIIETFRGLVALDPQICNIFPVLVSCINKHRSFPIYGLILRKSLFIRILMIRLIMLLSKLIVLLSYIHLFLASPLGSSDISPLSFIQLIFPFPKSYKAVSMSVTKLSVRVSLFILILASTDITSYFIIRCPSTFLSMVCFSLLSSGKSALI